MSHDDPSIGEIVALEAPRTAHLHGSDSEVDELVEATVRRWCLPRRTRLGDRFFAYVTDIANATVFLCTDEASFLTGVALPVDGGRLA